ncbi:MAG: efflux RND transporter periplasmic adaptor subunit [Bacteroidota bacterium]|nr:efflux RND transporter periplasmic adaptor subunit [Bacteroidota bacterium]
MKSKKNSSTAALLSLATLSIITAAYFSTFAGKEAAPENDSDNYVTVSKRDLTQSVTATGVIKPEVGAEVNVGAQVSGVVRRLYVEIGSKVKKNQLLALIDPNIYQSKADEARAQKESAAVEEKYARRNLGRYAALFRQKFISKQQFDADSQKVELARAKAHQAQAVYDFAILQLKYTRILSPINGVVANVATQEGETVAASFTAPTFVTIIDLSRLELWAYVDETDIGKIEKGQRVTFFVDTYPGETFGGTVKTIFPDALVQNNVVNYIVVVTVENRRGFFLRPRMDVTANIFTEYKKGVVAVPKRAVQFDESGRKYVHLLINGKPEKKYITTGISDEKYYEVVSGLSDSEKVIVN